ncbi:bifunctional phosphopantothenoylcysteine decarboxylase/phosphopantothenate--cysteine ligase CoaBC [Craterilacuibacter sinensis]|uniref:Coenzyme A biosynthesis bifunctional protein CoaBC n=1 Tax=Craterilacuibacter sinensis TaxID=2686017 RepID=A0A845BXZ5_9NEIS|nr:bifunctional phosphopantothenoylcysteine decarboxylase/phosphopantothenate--cysteine ligase CoaBC [Craterilacuibacter sinensis]MXR37383.1 bifunctional phosphopantothenoylcysteine decarboxylase/phosphopantothenate--cysteine ligase CoaBC [Craterilacuibacter sinensis]RQW23146.1 bifunctional phosphopantothenoylcysteine decarboxylase/phosphopantothenate--cysteine ligase CoaBC [Rhodobacteraceae bacterium CH30]
MTAKRILLGVTGGVAAYKAAELTRLFVKAGHHVEVVMTEAATRFVTPLTFQALSGHAVYTDLWDERPAGGMAHIDLSRRADLFLIAPASADTLFKLAHGACDNLLSTLAAARTCPLAVAPAMNRQMWENAPNLRNVAQLKADGVTILGPASGAQACGETGAGRMLEAEEIFELALGLFERKQLAGQRVLITAGPTYEPIDTVRGITNISSGKMGYALARACRDAGAEVTLVSGPTGMPAPLGLARIDVQSAREMYNAVLAHAGQCDVFIGVAAVADYRVKNRAEHKIKKGDGAPALELEENPDILATIAALPAAPFCVGFAAESQNLIAFADAKRRRKKLPLLVANLAQHAMGADSNEVTLLDDAGEHPLPSMDKADVARAIVQHLASLLAQTKNQ